jgi:hypothetical protein
MLLLTDDYLRTQSWRPLPLIGQGSRRGSAKNWTTTAGNGEIGNRSLWADKRGNAGGRQRGYKGAPSYVDAGLFRQIQTG